MCLSQFHYNFASDYMLFPLREAVEMGSNYIHDLKRVCVYVAQDCAGEEFSSPFTNTTNDDLQYSCFLFEQVCSVATFNI